MPCGIRTYGLDLGPRARLAPPQPAGWAHLVTVRSGVALVRYDGGAAFVAPGIGLRLCAGVAYDVDVRSACALRILYLAAADAEPARAQPACVGALLDALIDRAMRAGYLDPSEPRAAHLLAVIADEVASLEPPRALSALVFPGDPALCPAVDRALASLDERVSLAALAAAAAMSPRTFERRFLAATGMTPRAWFRLARITAAAAALAAGASVTDAALASGYASTSAFVAAYRATYGVTPGLAFAAARELRGIVP